MVAKEWRDTLSATPRRVFSLRARFLAGSLERAAKKELALTAFHAVPCSRSIWFKLLRAVDPAEADAAAAAAPAPSAAAAANADPFRDHDFRRRFVEQYCALRCACAALLLCAARSDVARLLRRQAGARRGCAAAASCRPTTRASARGRSGCAPRAWPRASSTRVRIGCDAVAMHRLLLGSHADCFARRVPARSRRGQDLPPRPQGFQRGAASRYAVQGAVSL